MASIPQRLHLVDKTVQSFARQSLPPELILLVLPHKYTRWPLIEPNLTLVHSHPLLEIRRCPMDDGPGTKSLCALPRLAELLRSSGDGGETHSGPSNAILVLADDDREYKPGALALMADAILYHAAASARMTSSKLNQKLSAAESAALALRAFSFHTNMLPNSHIGNHTRPLIVGQGADLFALPLGALLSYDGLWVSRAAAMRSFFELACSVDRDFYFHDEYATAHPAHATPNEHHMHS